MGKCKLQLNQELVSKKSKLDDEETFLIKKFGTFHTNIKVTCCLNCEKDFNQNKNSSFIFCSGKCADEFNKKRLVDKNGSNKV
jgi:hypothetical protein